MCMKTIRILFLQYVFIDDMLSIRTSNRHLVTLWFEVASDRDPYTSETLVLPRTKATKYLLPVLLRRHYYN